MSNAPATHVKIFPAHADALNVSHPIDGPCRLEGASWTYDSFTCRCLTDGCVTDDPAKAYKPVSAPTSAAAVDAAEAGAE